MYGHHIILGVNALFPPPGRRFAIAILELKIRTTNSEKDSEKRFLPPSEQCGSVCASTATEGADVKNRKAKRFW